MRFLQKTGWWGLDRRIILIVNEAEGKFHGKLVHETIGKHIVKEKIEFPDQKTLLDWVDTWPELPVCLVLELEEVVEGKVDETSTDWIGDVLGVKVAQPSLFWCQVKEESGPSKKIAVVRKTVLEEKMVPFADLESRLIGLLLFREINPSGIIRKNSISQPKQLSSNRVNFLRSKWICRLAVVVSCCCLVASLCFFVLGKNLQARTFQNQQQIAAFLPQLDSIQQNEARIDQQMLHLQQSRQMAPTDFSYYADQIAANAPQALSFRQLVFAPGPKERKRISPEFKNDSLDFILTGSARDALAITDFSRAIQELEIMESVDLRETNFDREARQYHFNLTGKLKDHEE